MHFNCFDIVQIPKISPTIQTKNIIFYLNSICLLFKICKCFEIFFEGGVWIKLSKFVTNYDSVVGFFACLFVWCSCKRVFHSYRDVINTGETSSKPAKGCKILDPCSAPPTPWGGGGIVPHLLWHGATRGEPPGVINRSTGLYTL